MQRDLYDVDAIETFAAFYFDVHSENGVIYVSGQVATYFEMTELDRVLKSTPGVTKFVNMTTVDNARF